MTIMCWRCRGIRIEFHPLYTTDFRSFFQFERPKHRHTLVAVSKALCRTCFRQWEYVELVRA